MRLALMIEGQEDVNWDEWLALAEACEEHGVESLFRSDHYVSVEGHERRGSLDAWATLAALAAVTSTVRLGTLVSPATFRHPSELAKVVTTVDHVSRGRVELGIGSGWLEREHEAYGFPFPPVGERMAALEEQIGLIARQWEDGAFSSDGPRYPVRDLDALPKPVQRPRPPLLLGGRGGPRSVALGARHADEYNTVHKTVDECAEVRAALDAACAEAGREPIPLSLMTGVVVGEDRDDLLGRARSLGDLSGDARDAEAMLDAIPDSWIVGTADEAVEQLRALADVGVERVMLQHLVHRDLDTVALIGGRLAPAVA